jgi:phosphocarrier protein HPr
MKQLRVRVEHEAGLHARPAATFVQTAAGFHSDIQLAYKGKVANAKSILSVLGLGVTHQAEVELTVDGPDEDAAVDALVRCLSETTAGAASRGPNSDPTA